MGKPQEQQQQQLGISDAAATTAGGGGICPCDGAIRRAISPRCVVVLLFSACVLLSAIFWLPPFRSRSRSASDDAGDFSAEIQASFVLQKSMSMLAAHAQRLEYDIFEEIGLPNTKVTILSLHPWTPTDSTCVVFGLLPDPNYASISSPALSLLRSSLTELVLQQLNLTLTPSVFGHPSSFEVLRFPGGITVIPVQQASIWEMTNVLFYFKLNNSIIQIQNNLNDLKDQLKFGLNLRSYENVYVQLTNENGSTIAPPVTVQTSILSDVGSRSLLPDRLKQLAQVITGSHAKNFGLNHSVFGKVKQVELSSYLQQSISSLEPPSPSPSLSPSPSPSPASSPFHEPPYFGDPPSAPTLSPLRSPVPLSGHCHRPKCLYCRAFSPSKSPLLHEPIYDHGPQPRSQSMNSHGSSITKIAPSLKHSPSPSHSPKSSLVDISYISASHSSSNFAPTDKRWSLSSQMAPAYSPLSAVASYGSSSPQDKGSGKALMSPMSISGPDSSSASSHVVLHYAEIWLTGLLGFLNFYLLYGLY